MNYKLFVLIITLFITHTSLAQNIELKKGSGFFKINGIGKHHNDSIIIFYHKPINFTQNSKILIVVPGAGRNGDSYRDSWIKTSEKHSVLILSSSYSENDYNYGDYHLGGLIKDLDLSQGVSFKKGTNQIHIDEDVIAFNADTNKRNWIFNDFDRIFELVKNATHSNQKKYDMFGHSAGGQILHRFVLCHPNSKADRILASNAGTYTLPDFETSYPFGIENLNIPKKQLKRSFNKKLVLFLGELDNILETRGRMLRSKTADKQGTSRIERGKNFYSFSKELTKTSEMTFNWELKIVPNVGHDQKKMAKAAAKYLYE
ncbi:MAG: hydrolase [Winogradskyella sp.]